jgi:hypothetical protein
LFYLFLTAVIGLNSRPRCSAALRFTFYYLREQSHASPDFPGLPLPHAARTHPCAARRHASPCTEQGCSYVLRQRPREGAPRHRSRLPLCLPPPRQPHIIVLCTRSRIGTNLMAQPLVTHALFASATPLPAPRESWHSPTLFAHMPSPYSCLPMPIAFGVCSVSS